MEWLSDLIINTINALGIFGPILSCFLIVIESMVPILPLFVFISLNFIAFGNLWGLLISLIFTIIGCMLSFCLFRYKIKDSFDKKIRDKEKVNKLMTKIDNLPFKYLTLIIAIPFTPAFLINIAAGLSKISTKKYFFSLLIGKIFLVYFWGYIGTSLVESIKNPIILIRIGIILLIAYIVAVIINKKLHID